MPIWNQIIASSSILLLTFYRRDILYVYLSNYRRSQISIFTKWDIPMSVLLGEKEMLHCKGIIWRTHNYYWPSPCYRGTVMVDQNDIEILAERRSKAPFSGWKHLVRHRHHWCRYPRARPGMETLSFNIAELLLSPLKKWPFYGKHCWCWRHGFAAKKKAWIHTGYWSCKMATAISPSSNPVCWKFNVRPAKKNSTLIKTRTKYSWWQG